MASETERSVDKSISDGLLVLKRHIDVRTIGGLIAATARWTDPATFRLLPLWYPEYARGAPLFNRDWTLRRQNRKRATGVVSDKSEGNTMANKALTGALGLVAAERKNWTCCHIWGVDDPEFKRANSVVQDHRYFSCVANMLLLPSPLKAFTDVMPEIKGMIRQCAADLYGWRCDHPELAPEGDGVFDPNDYPEGWHMASAGSVPGIMPLNPRIMAAAAKRKADIARDLAGAGESSRTCDASNCGPPFWDARNFHRPSRNG